MNSHEIRRQITDNCLDKMGFDPFQKSRSGRVCQTRQSIIYVLHVTYGFKQYFVQDITLINHSTVCCTCKKIEAELKLYYTRRVDILFWTKEIGKILDVISPFQSKVFDLFERLNVDESDRKLLNEIKIKLFYVE
jgi:hypothetical protein